MRARKKKHGKERLESVSDMFLERPIEKTDKKLRIEIGCGKGNFIKETAKNNPDVDFIAVERVGDVVLLAAEKIRTEGITNVRFLMRDAKELREIIGGNKAEVIYLNFSDPWPKDRHAKRRLTSPQFLALYDKVLADDGYIQFKTDNRGLFDYSVETVEASEKWKIQELTYDLHHSDRLAGNVMTEYESKFVGLGHPICRCVIVRDS